MSKLVCQNCGYENKNTMKFCINCGTKLEKETISVEKEETENRFCEECGHPVKPGEVFCENCGNKILKEEKIEEESTDEKVEGEPELEEDSVEAEAETEESSELEEQELDDPKDDGKKICQNCGKELKKTQDFCPACGTKFESKLEEKIEEPKEIEKEDSNDLEEEVSLSEEKSGFVFCIECGNKLNENQEFCPKCGAKVMGLDQEIEEDSTEKELPKESSKVDEMEDKVEEQEESQEVDSEEEIEEESTSENEKEEIPEKQAQAYCIECGKKLKKGQDFCIHCGAKVGKIVEEEIMNPQEEKSNKKKIVILLLLLFIVVCIVVCVIWKPWQKTTQKNEKKTEQKEVLVTVPSVIDKTQKEAIEILEELSLKVKIEEVETEDSEKVGIVFEQEPMDKKVKKNSKVIIKVYISMEKVEMVPVVGETLEDATKKLEAIGVATKIIEQSSDTVEKGKIISQEVSEGENVSKGSTVTITVSTGKEEEKEPQKETNTPKPTSTPTPTSEATSKPTPTSKSTPTPTPTPTPKANWSNWIASLPSNVNSNKYEIETKTQYRSRNKETTTSTSSSLSGWTRYDTKVEPIYSNPKTANVSSYDYNSFKKNTNNQIISEEVLNMDIIYLYCKNSNGNTAINKDKTCPSGYSMMATKQFKQEGIDNSIVGTYITRENMSVLVSSVTPSDRKITYREKTGDRYTYYYYRWGSWGSWQDNQIASNDETEVSTRTMYRYRAK